MTMDKQAVRARIIDITSGLIAAHGLEGFKIRDVAKEAGVSVGSVYNLFGDADGLLRVVNTRLLDALGEAGEAGVAEIERNNISGVRERLLLLSRVYFDFVNENQTAWSALLTYNRSIANVETPKWYLDRMELLFDIIAGVLRDTRLAEDETQLVTGARALWSSVHGIVTHAYRGQDDALSHSNTWAQIDLLISTFVSGLERP